MLGPKGPARFGGVDMVTWARNQLVLAGQIIDNPGGGLLFATQTVGQVKTGLSNDGERWADLVALLERAEDRAVRRELGPARELIEQALRRLG